MCFPYQSLYTTVYQSWAKLLQGTAALTSIVFGKVPAVTSNWHSPLTLANVLYSTQRVTSKWSLLSMLFRSSTCMPYTWPWNKTLQETYQNPALSIQTAQFSLVWICQNTPTMDPDRDMWPRACLCLHSAWTSCVAPQGMLCTSSRTCE